MRTFFFKKTPVNQKGFTLVELLVSIGIFSVITSVAVYNNSQFNSSVLLTNLAYEVALSIRQAQVYGVTVRRDSTGNFNSAYGIHFDMAAPTTYQIFEDASQNHIYDNTDPSVEIFNLQKGNVITKVCVDSTGLPDNCLHRFVDISFVRPNPDAVIRGANSTNFVYSKAQICVQSPQGPVRKIVVEQTGQISVGIDPVGGVCTNGVTYSSGGGGGQLLD